MPTLIESALLWMLRKLNNCTLRDLKTLLRGGMYVIVTFVVWKRIIIMGVMSNFFCVIICCCASGLLVYE